VVEFLDQAVIGKEHLSAGVRSYPNLWVIDPGYLPELWVITGSKKGKITFIVGDKERQVPLLFATKTEAETHLSSMRLSCDLPDLMADIAAMQLAMVKCGSLFVDERLQT
jgi:hypothetical protein